MDPLIRAVNAALIDKTTSNFSGETKHTYTSEAVCSIATTFDVRHWTRGTRPALAPRRQEENAYLANQPEDVLSWTPEVQRAMGYTMSSPNVGFVPFRQPLQYLAGDDGGHFGDFDPLQEKH